MSNVLVLLENDVYVRNFVTSRALDDLIERHDACIGLSEHVRALSGAVPAGHVAGRWARDPGNIRIVYGANKLSMLACRDLSTTFAIKCDAGWMGTYSDAERAFVSRHGVGGVREMLLAKIAPNPSLAALIEHVDPRVVVLPVTGVEATPAELSILSRDPGVRTLHVMNGWDNLSSKGVFLTRPDVLGVVGAQAITDAIEIQGMAPHRVVPLGCARYEPYYRPERHGPPIDRAYVLFAGCSLRCDELTPLRLLDDAVDRSGGRVTILYRPHPWRETRECDDVFRAEEFRHTILDPQIAESYLGSKRTGTESVSNPVYPALDYYRSLLDHATFVVSTLSSLILEAAILDVPSLLLAHEDGVHAISARQIAQFRHFAGSEDVPGWHRADTLERLDSLFTQMLETHAGEGPSRRALRPALSSAIRHYLHRDERTYATRLADTVDTMLAWPHARTGAVSAIAHVSER